MLRYILHRSLYSLLILLGVMLLTFVLFRMAAGDPSATVLGKNPKPAEVERLRISLGADKPLFYGKWRKTEAFTNAVFVHQRTEYNGVRIAGNFKPSEQGLLLEKGASVIFTRNFVPDHVSSLRVRAEADKDLNLQNVSGKTWPLSGTAPAEVRLTAVEDGTLLKSVTFDRESERPWDSQFLASLNEIVTFTSEPPYVSFFNFGNTLQTREPIRAKLWRGMWPSLFLMLPVFFGELLFGLFLAMISCIWRGSWIDRFIMILSVAGMSISYLALIIFGQWLLGYYWNWFPVWGWGGARYLVLPVIIGIISGTGSGVRFYRTVFLNEINREYLRTAVAKGASPVVVYGKHMMKNSLIPIITRASGILPFLFTGSLLLESFFGIPGLGNEGINALHDADLQMLKALVLLSSFLFVVINLATDIAYAYVDPRMRLIKPGSN